jgi:hypothetical protein
MAPIEHTVDDTVGNPYGVFSADVDGDGDMDVLVAAYSDNEIVWWENVDGTGTNWTEHTVESGFTWASSVYSADVDGDGDMDVLGASEWDDLISWWENTDGSGTSWVEHIVDSNFLGAWSVCSSDVDGDGDPDVLGAASIGSDITWWDNHDGAGTSWVKHVVDGDFSGAASVNSSDVDGDGDMDVLGAAYLADAVTWWENNDGTGSSWTVHTVGNTFDCPYCVSSADVDGDGDIDVLSAAYSANKVMWWENHDGAGTDWVEHLVDGSFTGGSSVHSADLDGDGDMDILGAAALENTVTWWENANGSGSIWTEHSVSFSYNEPWSISSADLDGDGDLDVLSASFEYSEVTWWEVTEFLAAGELTSSILDTEYSPQWGQITWLESVPTGTSLSIDLRAGSSPGSMGSWIEISNPGDDIPAAFDGLRYIQYRIHMGTGNTEVSPGLEEISLDCSFVGIEEGEETSWNLLGACPNPSSGNVQIAFTVSSESRIDLAVYDVSGRIVTAWESDCEDGRHILQLWNMESGLYFVRMRAAGFDSVSSFVVID